MFLPGEHVLNTSIVFQLFESLTLLGNTSSSPNITSKIICNGIPALTLTNISKVEIKALTFYSCGSPNKTRGPDSNINQLLEMISLPVLPAIAAVFIPNLQLLSCIMEHNVLSLLLYKTKAVSQDCVFDSNKGIYGGAVLAQDSIGVFAGQTVFKDNTAARDGGGIFANHSELIFRGSVTFSRNSANLQGGGLRTHNSSITFGNNVTDQSEDETTSGNSICIGYYVFETNSAGVGAGISLKYSTLNQTGGVLIFIGNWAHCGSGAASQWNYCGPGAIPKAASAGGAFFASYCIFHLSAFIAVYRKLCKQWWCPLHCKLSAEL